MIIYGTHSYRSILATGGFFCPCCKTQEEYQLIGMNRWFTLYFIPLIPLGRTGQFVECRRCSNTFSDAVLSQMLMSADVITAQLTSDAIALPSTQPFLHSTPI